MIYVLPFDLYEDWKELMLAKEVSENIVKELKEQMKGVSDMCEKCLYKKNCQFLAKHKQSAVDGCTAFESEAALKAEVAREIFEEIERGIAELYPILYAPTLNKFVAELKKKYTEEK